MKILAREGNKSRYLKDLYSFVNEKDLNGDRYAA